MQGLRSLLTLSWTVLFVLTLAPTTDLAKAAVFPLKNSPDARYLVDQKGEPFLVAGDTAWSLIVQLDEAGVERYLADRQARGFNSIIVNLLEHKFCTHPPKTRAGLPPFDQAGDFSTPNAHYFDWAHRVIEKASQHGIVVWLAPAYLGYGGGDEGFYREIEAGGRSKLASYGRFLSERFKDLPNIVWLIGGDFTPGPAGRWTITALGDAIFEQDKAHPMTVHTAPEQTAAGVFGAEPWLNVDTVYSYKRELFEPLLHENALGQRRPFVLIESTYEGEHDATPDQIRRQAYWTLLSGACGHFFGNNPIWHYDGPGLFPVKVTWEQALNSQGSRDLGRLYTFLASLRWWDLRPEQDHAVVVDGYGTGVATALTAHTVDHKLSLTYVPSTGIAQRELIVDTSRLPTAARAQWFNPISGNLVPADSADVNGSRRRFLTPGDNGTGANDWLLLFRE